MKDTFAKQKCKYLSYRKHALLLGSVYFNLYGNPHTILQCPPPPYSTPFRMLPEASSVWRGKGYSEAWHVAGNCQLKLLVNLKKS